MGLFIKNEERTKNKIINSYGGTTVDNLKKIVEDLFLDAGYKVKKSDATCITYEKGNRIKRLLLGGFTKYFKFDVKFDEKPEHITLEVKKTSTGMSGGLIGINQVKKEFDRIDEQVAQI